MADAGKDFQHNKELMLAYVKHDRGLLCSHENYVLHFLLVYFSFFWTSTILTCSVQI